MRKSIVRSIIMIENDMITSKKVRNSEIRAAVVWGCICRMRSAGLRSRGEARRREIDTGELLRLGLWRDG